MIRGCPREAHLVYVDGHVECVTHAGALGATGVQSRDLSAERSEHGELVSRHRTEEHGAVRTVIRHSSSPILRAGVQIVDSPGLSDPSCEELMEELTLAELDRVSAALVVFIHLPGIGKEEIRLLESMGSRKVDKVFLVCNVTDGLWENPTTRDTVIPWIREQIAKSEHCSLDPEDLRVYRVNARRAWVARRDNDEVAFASSGVPELLEGVETFLSHGVLRRLAERCSGHLEAASDVVRSVLNDRIRFLRNPEELERHSRRLSERQEARKRARDGILEEIRSTRELLQPQLGNAVRQPYEDVVAQVPNMTGADLAQLNEQLRLRVDTATSRANQQCNEAIDRLETKARRTLRDAFDLPEDPERMHRPVDGRRPLPDISVDHLTTGDIAGLAAVAGIGGAIGAPIAGGAGVAMIAGGPIGLILGAIAGAVWALYWTGESGLWEPAFRDNEKLRNQLTAAADASEQAMHNVVARAADYLGSEIEHRFDAFAADSEAELRAVRSFLEDRDQRDRHIADAQRLLAELPAIGPVA